MSLLLKNVVEILNEARASEDDKNYLEAIGHYNTALAHFASAAINDEIKLLPLKEEVKKKIDFCLSSSKKLILHQNTMYNVNMCESSYDDDKINKRIESTLLLKKPNVNFADVCGMDTLKKDLQLAIILPIKHPEFFSGKREPYKAFLFFGPPGTGKSYLAQAVAGQAGCSNFFSISASDVLSKYIGESESFIKHLFESARRRKPSIIFIDELDALVCKRTDDDIGKGRGMKTELFVQMEGVSGNNDGIFLLAATNTPYDLDEAVLRRFDKLVYIALPEERDRYDMFKKMLIDNENIPFSDENFKTLAAETKRFSASDIHKVCRKANILSICRLLEFTHYQVSKETDSERQIYTPCQPGDIGAIKLDLMDIPSGCVSYIPATTFEDALNCVRVATPVVTSSNIQMIEKFVEERCELSTAPIVTPRTEQSWKNILSDLLCSIFCCSR